VTPPLRRWLSAAFASAALVAAVSAVIALLDPRVPALGLGVLYLLAVLPIALVYGSAAAAAVSVMSMAAFTYLFLPPRYTLDPGTSDRWSVLVAFLVSSLVVGLLAARSQQEARRAARLADQQARLAEEQAALRRVATLVARGARPEELFAAVIEEVARLFLADLATIVRYDSDGTYTVLASAGTPFPVGSQWPLGGKNLATLMFETGRPARIESYADAFGGVVDAIRAVGVRSAIGTPIIVEDRLWGGAVVTVSREQPLPADTETRLASFMELVATAIANAEAQTELAASRSRIVAATDQERQRVVRDIHDGAQQRLVHTVVTLKLALRALQNGEQDLPSLVTEALDNAKQATNELRELAHGILPPVLTQGGLRAGVDALASRMPIPVENAVTVGRLPAPVEATAYFVVAEALTNVAKHAHARHAEVTARIEHGTLAIQVRDDGIGGARPDGGGSGLIGLADRVAAVDGELRVDSPADSGTLVAAAIPLPG
jgi:signal transduction histidine kinase